MHQPQTLPDLLAGPRAASQTIALFERPGQYRTLTMAALLELTGQHRPLALADLRDPPPPRLGDLQRAGVKPGDEVVMPIADAGAFLEVFWACQLGGQVPMPLAPPTNDSSCSKILDILGRRGDARLIVEDDGLARLETAREEAGLDASLTARRLWPVGDGAPGTAVDRSPGELAFIQYSSGSTRAPKGVIIRHAQALANLGAIRAGAELVETDRTFSWMPLSHDMGLVGFHLSPLFAGADQVILPTSAFARSPLVWLTDASAMGATILSSPNFGYRHTLRAVERKGLPEGVDLSKVRLIMNGAEPISVELAGEFLARLEPAGLSSTAMLPVYGLAEATLAVTFPALGSSVHGIRIARSSGGLEQAIVETDEADSFVACGCGAPLPGLEVRIAGRDGGSLADDTVGRLWIRGAGVTEGYHEDSEATSAAVMGEGWLDTGDLGFLRNGELFVTGRLKDLVIVGGQNFYPHDLDEGLQAALGIDPLRVAVAPVRRPGGMEEIAVFVVHRGDVEAFRPTAETARGHLAEAYGVGVELVVPVAQIPRTTSGKVQRHLLAKALLDGEFDTALGVLTPKPKDSDAAEAAAPVEAADDPASMEAMLMAFCDQVLGANRFGPEDNVFEQGMSSIDLAEIHGLVEARYPKGLDIRDFFDAPTVRGLSAILSERVRTGTTAPVG